MIIAKAPLKISLLGGGTDIESFYNKHEGNVFSFTINQYVHVIYRDYPKFFDENYRLQYSESEKVYNLNNIKNNIIRETFKKYNVFNQTHILTYSDLPSGNGLGSSSAFCAALVKAIYLNQKKKISKKKLIDDVCDIEINKVKSPIGKQDQACIINAGLNNFIFKQKKIKRNNFSNYKNLIKEIENNCAMFLFSNQDIIREKILQNQIKKNYLGKNIDTLNKMANISKNFCQNLNDKKDQYLDLAERVRESWELKKKVSNKISNKKLEEFLQIFDDYKVPSYKLLGAGGKGFVLVFFKSKFHKKNFLQKHKNLRFLNFKLSYDGVTAIKLR